MFDITPYLHPDDPWVKKDGVDFIRRIYLEKHALVTLLKPSSILEIGVRAGYSAAAFLSAVPTAHYLGLDADNDTHGGWVGAPKWAEKSLREKFPRATVEVQQIDTRHLAQLPRSADLIHVDGCHDFDGALHDLRLAVAVRPQWILFDDITFDGNVRQAAGAFLLETGFRNVAFSTVRGDLLVQLR